MSPMTTVILATIAVIGILFAILVALEWLDL